MSDPVEEMAVAQRMCDAVNLHVHAIAAEGEGREQPGFVAIRLSDGRFPGRSAVRLPRRRRSRHHHHDRFMFFVRVGRETMPLREALIVLQMARMAFKRGVIFSEEEVIVPQMTELMHPFIPNTLRRLRQMPML
jgi:hypothetical protein